MRYSPRLFITISCFSLAALLVSFAVQACPLPAIPASAFMEGNSPMRVCEGKGTQVNCLSRAKQADQSLILTHFSTITWVIDAMPAATAPVRETHSIITLFLPGLLIRKTGPPRSILFRSFQI